MNKYNVFVYNAATYEGVEANSEEEAKRMEEYEKNQLS